MNKCLLGCFAYDNSTAIAFSNERSKMLSRGMLEKGSEEIKNALIW